MSRKINNIQFKDIMQELKYLDDSDDLPQRNHSQYIDKFGAKGIEEINIHDFNSCLILQMAIRNKNVTEILSKFNSIENLIAKYPYLDYGNDILLPSLDNKNKEDLFKELVNISKLPLIEFTNKLQELVDLDYSANYNENYQEKMENDGCVGYKRNKKIIQKYKFKDPKGKTKLDKHCITFGKLFIIMRYFDEKLKNNFFIYPDGYIARDENNCSKNLIAREYLDMKRNEIKEALLEFRKLKPTDMETVADYFFIYDYYKKRVANGGEKLIYQDIKYALTKHYGITIKNTKEKISYEKCLENYDQHENSVSEFYIVEKSIRERIKFMEYFIDNENYKYLIF